MTTAKKNINIQQTSVKETDKAPSGKGESNLAVTQDPVVSPEKSATAPKKVWQYIKKNKLQDQIKKK